MIRISDSTSGAPEGSVAETYASLLLLSRVDFIAKLKDGQFSDIQGFCKAVQISAKGGRTELENRLVEYKDKHDARQERTMPLRN